MYYSFFLKCFLLFVSYFLLFLFICRTRKHWLEERTLLVNRSSRMLTSTVSGYWEGYLEAMGAWKSVAFAVIAIAVGAAVMSPNMESLDWNKLSVLFTQQSFQV